MNKKEFDELKKQFKPTSHLLVVHNIARAYVKESKDIHFYNCNHFDYLGDEEKENHLKYFKTVLSGVVGKNLLEYDFNQDSQKARDELDALLKNFDNNAKKYIENIVSEISYDCAYYISLAICTYSVPEVTADGKLSQDIEMEHNFIICSINPMGRTAIGLIYDEKDKDVKQKINLEVEVKSKPLDGFMYPTFNDRTTDIHSVVVYSKDKNAPKVSLIENVLGCEYEMSPLEENEKFHDVLIQSLGKDLTYKVMSSLNQQINEKIEANIDEPDIPTVNLSDIKSMLQKAGVASDNLETLSNTFEGVFGDTNVNLKAVNITQGDTIKVATTGVTIAAKATRGGRIRTEFFEGQRCLVIPIDNTVVVNGVEVAAR